MKRAQTLSRAFNSPAGKEALQLLRNEFQPKTLVDPNPIVMAANARAREIFDFIDNHLGDSAK